MLLQFWGVTETFVWRVRVWHYNNNREENNFAAAMRGKLFSHHKN
jgi:hypothetical protein